MEEIRLTQYSHGSGCGCKIAPADLEEILGGVAASGLSFPALIIGNDTRDDAAVWDNGQGKVIISTTDFFTPIVDDPTDFGKISAANAINDIYAMGGKPLMAIAVLGWPIGKLSTEIAGQVVEGGRQICEAARIPLAGGHSIDSPEPFFGLAVTGEALVDQVKYNGRAQKGDLLFLTKPIGTGIISTAQKRGAADPEHIQLMTEQMMALNKIGSLFGEQDYIHAMTDVTGFGLLGHLIEVCEGSKLSAKITFDKVPLIDKEALDEYLGKFIFPDNTFRNFKGYGSKVSTLTGKQLQILCDPQTSGGLLVAVAPDKVADFLILTKEQGFELESFGELIDAGEKVVEVV